MDASRSALLGRFPRWPGLILAGVVLLTAFGLYRWFVVRVELDPNEILILVNKTGRSLPDDLRSEYGDQVVLYPELISAIAASTGRSETAVREGTKGIRYEVVGPGGRHYYDPFFYGRFVHELVEIGPDEIGILIRRFGNPLPAPRTVATAPDERGPVAKYLGKGKHPVNRLAYDVQRFAVPQIPEGHAGVVTLLSGTAPELRNTYTVGPGEKGVQRQTLPPGRIDDYNPYLQKIEIVDIRSHKYDMLNDGAIRFPSNDGFTILLEGTIEWAIHPQQVAEVTVAYGDEEDILNKIILPNARSISRIQGSKLKAREFISGKQRQEFQGQLLKELRHECDQQGIVIKAALVRDIHPPPEIASLISQREQADQEIERSTNQMEEARAEARLVEQQELQSRNSALGNAKRDVVALTKSAEQRMTVSVTEARREFEVAKLDLQSAEKEAAAIRSRGEAEARVVLLEFEARAEPLQAAVAAFGDGERYAQRLFLEKVAPAIRSIQSNTDGPFADIFRQFQNFTTTGDPQ